MNTNYSKQTYDTLLLEYQYRVEALLRKLNKVETKLLDYEKKSKN